MKSKTLLFLLIIFFFNVVYSQNEKKIKNLFVEAGSNIMYGDFANALPIYLDILDKEYNNANIQYCVGLCYVNIEGKKINALEYLKEASKDISSEWHEGSYKEIHAPPEAFFYLGKAYLINYELDNAIEAFEKYLTYLNVDDVYFIDFVKLKIQQCKNAKELMASPLEITKVNIGNKINDNNDNFNPVISGDGNTLIYTTLKEIIQYGEKGFVEDIFIANKDGDNWINQKKITSQINSDGYLSTVGISTNGDQILFFRDDFGNGNIYISTKEGGKNWSEVKKMSKKINTKSGESHACFSPDGNTIYFVSDRSDGIGGRDIYKSTKNDKGKWDKPINLGETINTPFHEDTPFLLNDGKTLYFSSESHYSMGGYDIFYSKMSDNGEWSEPVNIGYPINTTDDDLFYMPVKDGKRGYLSLIDENGFGGKDIYDITILGREDSKQEELIAENVIEETIDTTTNYTDTLNSSNLARLNTEEIIETNKSPEISENPEPIISQNKNEFIEKTEKKTKIVKPIVKNYLINGTISLQDNKELNSSFVVQIYDKTKSKTIASINPDILTGKYSYTVEKGDYSVSVEGNAYNKNSKDVVIPDNFQGNHIALNLELVPKEVSTGDYYVIKSVFFDFNQQALSRDTKIQLEKLYLLMKNNSSLYIEILGHTDSKGGVVFNKQLSEKRAQAVKNYIANKGVKNSRFVTLGLGERDAIAINHNADGTDNPEGRKLNRRVDVKILNSDNSKIVTENIYVPDYLKADNLTYSILLVEQEMQLPVNYFTKYKGETINNVWFFPTNKGYMYTVGVYKHKSEALQLLNKAVDIGFPEAKIINSIELQSMKDSGSPETIERIKKEKKTRQTATYTIQLFALKNPVELNYFKNVQGVEKNQGNDGFYRYTIGKYKGYNIAKQKCQKVINKGYKGAFIIKK
ncbi:MAG: OmpA family protein [Bacteroidetes bacterium]|nr:OmpA family protein [Bacteroidota bacterium]